jgi:hypothetical protein
VVLLSVMARLATLLPGNEPMPLSLS